MVIYTETHLPRCSDPHSACLMAGLKNRKKTEGEGGESRSDPALGVWCDFIFTFDLLMKAQSVLINIQGSFAIRYFLLRNNGITSPDSDGMSLSLVRKTLSA